MNRAGVPTNTTGSGVVEDNERKILVKGCLLYSIVSLSLALTMSQLSKLYLFTFTILFRLLVGLLQASSFLEVVHGAIGNQVLLECYPFLWLNLQLYLLKRSRWSKCREEEAKVKVRAPQLPI